MISLDDIATGAAPSLTKDDVRSVLCRLAAIQSRIAAHLDSEDAGAGAPPDDHLLAIDEAAGRLGVTRAWLYRRSNNLPFVVRLGRKIRYSSTRLDRFIAARSR